MLAAVAQRWKTQVNENSKTFGFYELYPKLTHNAIVGYTLPAAARLEIAVVELDSTLINLHVRRRLDVTDRIMQQAGIRYYRVPAQGQSPLAQIYAAITLGDYVTYYLAILNGVDPTPVETISYLKDLLATVAP